MNEIIYREDDLDHIFIRAQRPNGRWDSLSLTEISDKQFLNWARDRFGIKIRDEMAVKGTPWTPQQKVHFLNDISDRLGQPAVFMIKREARQKRDKGNKNGQ